MTEDLKALAERAIELAGEATAGPWHTLKMAETLAPEFRVTGIYGEDCKIYHAKLDPICLPETHERQIADATFIAFARTALPKLAQAYLDALDKLAEAEKWRDIFSKALGGAGESI